MSLHVNHSNIHRAWRVVAADYTAHDPLSWLSVASVLFASRSPAASRRANVLFFSPPPLGGVFGLEFQIATYRVSALAFWTIMLQPLPSTRIAYAAAIAASQPPTAKQIT